jgi:hypothetical protein
MSTVNIPPDVAVSRAALVGGEMRAAIVTLALIQTQA